MSEEDNRIPPGMCRRLTDNKDNAFKGMEVFPSLGNLLLGMFVLMHSFMLMEQQQ